MGHAHSDPSLALAVDITNTYKHSERDPGKRTCKITDAITRPGGSSDLHLDRPPRGASP